MRWTKTLVVAIVAIAFTALAFSFRSPNGEGKEVLVVTVEEAMGAAMYFDYPGQEQTKVDLKSAIKLSKNSPTVEQEFSRLYNDGWRIESTTTIGSAAVTRYVFMREK